MTASIDPNEIERFNVLAATWWDPDGPMRPLHKLVTPAEAPGMLDRGGPSVLETRGVTVNPVLRSIKVAEFTGMNCMLAAARHA